MDSAAIGVLIGGTALIALTLWFFFGVREDATVQAKSGKIIYACPMHPWITSNDPAANCTICKMKLVQKD